MVDEFLVTDCKKVAKFIDDKIGIDYEITYEDNTNETGGSVVVFDIEYDEYQRIRKYISTHGLWSE
jgi:hypothetical protein